MLLGMDGMSGSFACLQPILTGYQGLEKNVPEQPRDHLPVHLRRKMIYAHEQIPGNAVPFVSPRQLEELKANEFRRKPIAPRVVD